MNPSASSHLSAPFLRLPQVISEIGQRKTFIYTECKAGRFPSPIKIGRSSVWDAAEVERWKACVRAGKPWTPNSRATV